MTTSTTGAILAAEVRKKCNKITRAERQRLLDKGMAIIYGSSPIFRVNALYKRSDNRRDNTRRKKPNCV
jgi:hypothetical protein